MDGTLPKLCPAVALSRQDGRHSAVALLLKAALIQVSDYRLLGASGFFIIKCQECNKNRQNVLSTTNYFAILQRINVVFFTNGYLSLKFENFAVLSKNSRYYFDNKNFIR